MDFEQALVYELQAINGLSNKVIPSSADENMKPPYIVYVSSDGEEIMTLTGSTGITELKCDVHVIAESYEQLKSVTKAVLNRIKSFFRRQIGQNGPLIKSVSYLEPEEDFEKNMNYHRSSIEIRVRY